MTDSRKLRLIVGLVLVVVCVPTLSRELNEAGAALKIGSGEETNQPKTELKFEISNEQAQSPAPSIADNPQVQPPAQATHVAVLSIIDFNKLKFFPFSLREREWVRSFLEMSAARSMSQKQKEFCLQADWLTVPNVMFGYRPRSQDAADVYLYAVSQDDARKLAQAFLKYATNEANAKMEERKNHQRKLQEKIADTKKKLPGKDAELEDTKAKYWEFKKTTHDFSSDSEATKEAKETILDMNKMLDLIDVELAGIQEKLKVIENYKRKRGITHKPIYAKLTEMEIEQIVELKGAEARKKAIVGIRKREKEFLDLFNRWTELDAEVHHLKNTLDGSQEDLRRTHEMLANPEPDMLPPNIFQNKVVIHPVRVDE